MRNTVSILGLASLLLATSTNSIAQVVPKVRQPMPSASDATRVPMPSADDIAKGMRDAQTRARQTTDKDAMDAAQRRSQIMADPAAIARGLPQGQLQDVPMLNPGKSADPLEIARQYKQMPAGAVSEDERFNLIVFVSLSMPVESLKRLAADTRKAGGVVVLRGLKFGLKPGTWLDSIEAMKPLAETGASVQINPELFQQFGIRSVPTIVVTANPVGDKGCGDGSCAAGIGTVVGDVTLGYALDVIGDRRDNVGAVARQKSTKLD